MIQEGDYALFKKGDVFKIFQIKKKKPVMIDRFKCKFDNLIDNPYGFQYEIINQEFFLKTNEETDDSKNDQDMEGKDNRNLVDETKNQKLTRDDIEEMKEDLSGKEIIEKLIQNSASFDQKTAYSKEKYLKRKKEKYLPIFQIIKPTIRTLCEYYTTGTMKRKILNMRIDTIGQILTYGNVAAFRNVMVVESCKGLILSAIAERVGGYGTIINLSPNGGDNTTKQSLEHMNFNESTTKIIQHFPLEKADKIKEHVQELETKISNAENETYKQKLTDRLSLARNVHDLFVNKNIDCFILASKYRPLPILQKLIGYVNSNRNFVIYSSVQEALLECHKYLKETQRAVHMELSSTWLREYQVIPERTHPKVMMDCSGGYLLTGITVSN